MHRKDLAACPTWNLFSTPDLLCKVLPKGNQTQTSVRCLEPSVVRCRGVWNVWLRIIVLIFLFIHSLKTDWKCVIYSLTRDKQLKGSCPIELLLTACHTGHFYTISQYCLFCNVCLKCQFLSTKVWWLQNPCCKSKKIYYHVRTIKAGNRLISEAGTSILFGIFASKMTHYSSIMKIVANWVLVDQQIVSAPK